MTVSDDGVLYSLKGQRAFAEELATRWSVHISAATLDAIPETVRPKIRAMVTSGSVGASAALMQGLPNLRLVTCFGSGFEGVDLKAARDRGIVVTHAPGANASSVADMAIGLMIASVRRIAAGDRFIRAKHWLTQKKPSGERGLTGRRLGIFGLGAIGEKIALRATALEMDIGYHNRTARTDVPWQYHPTLLDLAKTSDILMVACRAGEETRNAVNAVVLDALGPDGHVVNISRGSVIDEAALIDALRHGKIAGAGLDVFVGEPNVSAALQSLETVVMTPHLGGATADASAATAAYVLRTLEAFFSGQAVPYLVPSHQTPNTAPSAA